jgi:hypothetical protein
MNTTGKEVNLSLQQAVKASRVVRCRDSHVTEGVEYDGREPAESSVFSGSDGPGAVYSSRLLFH